MEKAKANAAGALLLALLVLTSCFAASSSYCIPRRLLMVSTYYRRPCNEESLDRPSSRTMDSGDGRKEAQGSRIPRMPPSPKPYSRAMSDPAAAPGSNY